MQAGVFRGSSSVSTSNKILVTGAAGHLGSHLIPELVADGFEVKGLDVVEPKRPLPEGCALVKADLTDADAVRAAIEGADIIVHCASIHPWKAYTDNQYLDNNIKGTWTLYTVGAELGIDKIVLTSSIAAAGMTNVPHTAWPIGEEQEFALGAIYSLTKRAQEDIAGMFADKGQVRTIALRPPAFMPLGELSTGTGLLSGKYSVVGDVAAPHAAAVRVMAGRQRPGGPLNDFEAFNITNQPPYTREDVEELGPDACTGLLAKKYWPEAYAWLVAEHNYEDDGLPIVYDNSKVKRILGWKAQYTFARWFAEHGG